MYDLAENVDSTSAIEARRLGGLELAALVKIEKVRDLHFVPSLNATSPTKYMVKLDEDKPTCNCSDFETTARKCKHIYAVEYFLAREKGGKKIPKIDPETVVDKPRKTYRQNWPAYNAAQQNEKQDFQILLADLCKDIIGPGEGGKASAGRPPIPLRDVLFATVFKVYSTFSGRRFTSDLCDAESKGFIRKVPHYNTIFRCFENPEMFTVLSDLVTKTSLPLKSIETKFAVDSTGFAYSRFVRWFDIKYDRVKSEQQWIKAHICTGINTNVVTAVEIHESSTHDAPILPSLVKSTAENFEVKEVMADKAYSSRTNFKAIGDIGADPYIMFKANATGGAGGTFEKAWHFFNLHRETYLKHYHQRSNVESTVMMIKTKFGDSVKSKLEVAAKNEVLCKILCHNICCLISAIYELGIDPSFN